MKKHDVKSSVRNSESKYLHLMRPEKCPDSPKVQLDLNQIVQAHTILKSVVHKYADKPVLVLGGRNDVVRKVAQSYGFKHAYTTLDVLAWKPE